MDSAPQDWGRLHVNQKCCGTMVCRNFAPELLGEVAPSLDEAGAGVGKGQRVLPGSHDQGAFTGVIRQPQNKTEYLAARTAAAACPFTAIQLDKPAPGLVPSSELGSPWRDWPKRLEGTVWVMGHPSPRNFGALAFFIERPGGNVLVDCPKPSEELFRWLETHGGIRWLFLTHRDHVQHHAEFAARFPECRRVMGAAEVNKRRTAYADATDAVEIQLASDRGPMTLDGVPIPEDELANADLALLPQPGHTPGGFCLAYQGRFLFTGDHLSYSRRLGHIVAPRLQCWEDWERQCRAVNQLAIWAAAGQLRFQWLLPGHGEWHRLEGDGSAAVTSAELERAVDWMKRQPPGHVPLLMWIPYVLSRTNPRGWLGRFVRTVGGKAGEAWVIPRAARRYLVDYDAAATDAAIRRLYWFGATAFATISLIVWLATRAL